MNTNNENKRVVDSGRALDESAAIIRYLGHEEIRQMIENGDYIGAFVHAQLGVEKILWDKVERKLNKPIPDKSLVRSTFELIKWAHFMGLIDATEFEKLGNFNTGRNKVIHGHGVWWDAQKQEYRSALEKAIQFLENNNF